MKHKITRKLIIDLTLDSSEAVMFNQGGQHKISLNPNIFTMDPEEDSDLDIIEITVQLDRTQVSRHEWLMKESANAIQRRENETK